MNLQSRVGGSGRTLAVYVPNWQVIDRPVRLAVKYGCEAKSEEASRFLIDAVIDRSAIKLPDWFVPLARGIAIASHALLLKSGQRRPSDRPLGWRKTNSDVFNKRAVPDKDMGFATLTVRQYANQRWWTIERYHEDRKYEDITDVLVFVFGSTPIFCWNYQSAMRLAEFATLTSRPLGYAGSPRALMSKSARLSSPGSATSMKLSRAKTRA